MDARSLLLTTAFRNVINEPNIEAGYTRFAALIDHDVSYEAFCDAVAACLRDRLIHEPVRLPEGALQCHWHLELTPSGAAMARSLPDIGGVNRSLPEPHALCPVEKIASS
jgi:hypothetical protein